MLRAVRLAAKLGLTLDARDARADPRAGAAHGARAAGAPVRRDAEAAAVRARQRLPAPAARGRPAQGPAAAARRDPRAAARRALRHARARADRRARARRAAGVAGVPVRRAALARGARGVEGARRRAASARSRRWRTRWTRCSTRSARSSPSRASSPRRCARSGRMQPRFEQRSGQRAYRLLESPRFRMAYDFLALRAASGEVPAELEAWWRAFQSADADTRKAMLLPETGPRKRRRRRRRKKRPARRRRRPRRRDARLHRPRLQPRRPRSAGRAARFDELAALPHTRLVARSSLYRSAPVGYAAQPDFINAVAQLDTGLPARARCSPSCRRSRRAHGRARSFANAPRTLDLDLLLYGDAAHRRAGARSCRIRACTSARSCSCPCSRSRRRRAIPGRGARDGLPRAVATRTSKGSPDAALRRRR